MNTLIDILKYILPAGIVFAVTYFLIKSFLDNEQKKRTIDIEVSTKKIITPIRLQAYERIVLLLERISPNNLILRVNKPGIMAFHLQTSLIKTIREEFDHNLSQQLYLSSEAWELIKNAKEEVIKLINTAAAGLNETSSGIDLVKIILDMESRIKNTPINIALEYVKNEVRSIF
ncbi:MAG: hypothetical protein K8R58_15605 [Bacteroidales bacterium]|nr:hypothetical protein [Bacteroidales bacterium]